MERVYASIIGALWLVLIIYWIISAFKSKKNVSRYNYRFWWFRLGLIAVLLIVNKLLNGNNTNFDFNIAIHNPVVKTIGLVIFLAGFGLAIWARRYIGRNWGMPMSVKAEPELVTTGPYRYVRHPIYSGLMLAIAGTALAISLYWVIILIAASIYFSYSAKKEEAYLTKEFPKNYPSYKKSTKMLIPFIF